MKKLTISVAILACLLLAGCAEKDYGQVLTAPPDPQKEIDRIQNDPNMPQKAKDMAIGQIKARMGEGAARAEVTKGGEPTTAPAKK
jgi:outer membrane murein-binding lipoprotein Lpp